MPFELDKGEATLRPLGALSFFNAKEQNEISGEVAVSIAPARSDASLWQLVADAIAASAEPAPAVIAAHADERLVA